MTNSIKDKVLSLLPSKALKNKIKELNHQFTDIELMQIAFLYAQSFDERIELLKEIQSEADVELQEYIRKLTERQYMVLEEFKKNEAGTVYEVHIKEKSDTYEESYLCDSYESVLAIIPEFYKEYENEEPDGVRYKIFKRRLFSGKADDFFEKEYISKMYMRSKGVIRSVESFILSECDGVCMECDRICVTKDDVMYPRFVSDKEVVEFEDYDGRKRYGVVSQDDCEAVDEYYVYSLDSEQIIYHDFENLFYAHEHIPAPLVEKIDFETIPEKMKNDYFAYLEFIKENW